MELIVVLFIVIAALVGALAVGFGADSREFGERDRGLWTAGPEEASLS